MKKNCHNTGLCFFASGVYAYDVVLEFSGGENRGPVLFDHELHMYDFDCLDCHHVMENGENVLDDADLLRAIRIFCVRHVMIPSLKSTEHRPFIINVWGAIIITV